MSGTPSADLRNALSLACFRSQLKTHLCRLAFNLFVYWLLQESSRLLFQIIGDVSVQGLLSVEGSIWMERNQERAKQVEETSFKGRDV